MPVQYAQSETVIVNCFSLDLALRLIGNLTSSAKYYKFFMYSSLSPVERSSRDAGQPPADSDDANRLQSWKLNPRLH